jgi:hypothetical protein
MKRVAGFLQDFNGGITNMHKLRTSSPKSHNEVVISYSA